MSRTYTCDADGCGLVMDPIFISVQYWVTDDDGEDDEVEAHFCSWVCASSFLTSAALDFPPEPA